MRLHRHGRSRKGFCVVQALFDTTGNFALVTAALSMLYFVTMATCVCPYPFITMCDHFDSLIDWR